MSANYDTTGTVTRQRIVFNSTGTKHIIFDVQKIIEQSEFSWTVLNSKGSKTIIYKDSMFAQRLHKVINTISIFAINEKDFHFDLTRYVLGDATHNADKAEYFSAINILINNYFYKEAVNNHYLNNDGQVCKKDQAGFELVIDYVFLSSTSKYHASLTYKYPEKSNNYPIPASKQPLLIKKTEVVITAPKMSVNEWLNTPLESLMSDEQLTQAAQNKLKREQRCINNGLWLRSVINRTKIDKQRLIDYQAKKELEQQSGFQLPLM